MKNCSSVQDTKYKQFLQSEEDLENLSELFKTLGNASRTKILFCLLAASKTVSEIADATNLSMSNVSHQLRILQLSRIVKSTREGKHIRYSMDDDHIETLFLTGLEHIQHD